MVEKERWGQIFVTFIFQETSTTLTICGNQLISISVSAAMEYENGGKEI